MRGKNYKRFVNEIRYTIVFSTTKSNKRSRENDSFHKNHKMATTIKEFSTM